MKLYIHHEQEGYPNKTFIYNTTEPGETVKDLLNLSGKKLKNFDSLNTELIVKDSYGDNINSKEIINNVASNKDDFFVYIQKRKVSKSSKSRQITSSNSNSKSNSISINDGDINLTKEDKLKLDALFNKKLYRKLTDFCTTYLKQYEHTNKLDKESLYKLKWMICKVDYATKRYPKCIKNIYFLIKQKNHFMNKTMEMDCYILLLKSLINQEEFEEALDLLNDDILTKSNSIIYMKHDINKHLTIIACQIECYVRMNNDMKAAEIVNSYVGLDEADLHVDILVIYSELALKHGKIEEGMRSLLKALVRDQKNKHIKTLFATTISYSVGLQELRKQLPVSTDTASAMAYLATIAKEESQLSASITLYQDTCKAMPTSASYALNLMHVYETLADYESALRVALNFLKYNSDKKDNKEIEGLSITDLYLTLQKAISSSVKWGSNKSDVSLDDEINNEYSVAFYSDNDRDRIHVKLNNNDTEEDDNVSWIRSTYAETDFDMIAIGFTIIKILYITGRLQYLPLFFKLIEPCRQISTTPLHETNIRNEHAYYLCIGWVISLQNRPSLTNNIIKYNASKKPIYILGDSHTISIAWSVIKQKSTGEERILVPKLVTGIKHWHLRNDSRFYPKAHFYNMLKTIPNKSDVIIITGEIDCREGIPTAVERGYYDDIDAGISATVKIFKNVVYKIIKEKQLNVLIHPISPVLKETRQLVKKYTNIYKKEMKVLSNNGLSVNWLNFEDDLLDENGDNLREEYKLDGTHLNPEYLKLMEKLL